MTPVEVLYFKNRDGRWQMRVSTAVRGKQVQVYSGTGEDIDEHCIATVYGLIDQMLPDVCQGCSQEIDPNTCGCGQTRDDHGHPLNVGHSFIPMGCDCLRVD